MSMRLVFVSHTFSTLFITVTFHSRDKEEKQDYRYMPEPNLLPLNLSQLQLNPSDYRARIPSLPEAERNMLKEKYQINLETAMQLVVSKMLLVGADFKK